jgi:hypothetical protein
MAHTGWFQGCIRRKNWFDELMGSVMAKFVPRMDEVLVTNPQVPGS